MGKIIEPITAARSRRTEFRSVAVSLILHIALAVCLWLFVFAAVSQKSISLTFSSATPSGESAFEFAAAPAPPIAASIEPAEPVVAIDPLVATSAATGGLSEILRQSLNPPAIDFFGSQAYGTRFVFVLDISYSMDARDGERYRRACDELVRSVSQLTGDQSYYVILFCWETFEMFYDPASQYVVAREDHIEKLRKWIYDVRLGSGTDPRRGLALAHKMKPDAVFLLTDGQFNTPGTPLSKSGWIDSAGEPFEANVADGVQRLFQDRRIPIHTIAFENPFTLSTMQEIAEATGGNFRYVKTQHHHPVDAKRFQETLRQLNSIAQQDTTRGGGARTRLEDPRRLRYARDLISDGELVYAEYILRPVRQESLLAGYERRNLAELQEILDSELGPLRLEDFGLPPDSSPVD